MEQRQALSFLNGIRWIRNTIELVENMNLVRKLSDLEYRYAFYLQRAFIVGIATGLFPYTINALQILVKLKFVSENENDLIDLVFYWILFLVPIIIFITLLILRRVTKKSFKFNLINTRKTLMSEQLEVKSEGRMMRESWIQKKYLFDLILICIWKIISSMILHKIYFGI